MTANPFDLTNLRLAVLIDAENVPRNCIKRVMEEIAIYGTPTIKRIYGDWTSAVVSGWKNSLLENAITPIQQYSYTQGKNSSDSAMIIDAMDILYAEKTDGFVLVSSDSDFTRLALRLREAGQRVIGIGEKKTPSPFIAACDKFIYIEVIRRKYAEKAASTATQKKDSPTAPNEVDSQNGDKPQVEQVAGEVQAAGDEQSTQREHSSEPSPQSKTQDSTRAHAQKIPTEIVELIAGSVADLAGDSGSVFMGELGNLILKKQPDFDHRSFGFKSLSTMIKSISRFEIEFRQTTDPNIKHVFVRDREA